MAKKKDKISSDNRNTFALIFFVTIFIYGMFAYLCNYFLKKDDEE